GFRRREAARAQLALACLAALDLGARADEMAQDLPYGEQKLLAIAMALAARPRLLLLDEIAGGLTDDEATALTDTINDLRRDGVSIVWIEHVVRALLRVVDRLAVINFGRLLQEGLPDEVMASRAVREVYMGIEA
ncbi:ATP-binding cassette domain-containing protein, partial [Salmonella enterica]|uniref:ATP-binding cassette domain-containing protein n=1 Tax=Salmonella enterica TaxID=28901 RepID=UPI003D29042E